MQVRVPYREYGMFVKESPYKTKMVVMMIHPRASVEPSSNHKYSTLFKWNVLAIHIFPIVCALQQLYFGSSSYSHSNNSIVDFIDFGIYIYFICTSENMTTELEKYKTIFFQEIPNGSSDGDLPLNSLNLCRSIPTWAEIAV
ncbi:hypothetical protein LIER_18978 [Lithospermum erythrorhizon]|uniref:Uncharacterized protein n=1 Tax=Lithospermum erythrorhizon TaxID=34254 RepID=A0AAV3QG00_LITER